MKYKYFKNSTRPFNYCGGFLSLRKSYFTTMQVLASTECAIVGEANKETMKYYMSIL